MPHLKCPHNLLGPSVMTLRTFIVLNVTCHGLIEFLELHIWGRHSMLLCQFAEHLLQSRIADLNLMKQCVQCLFVVYGEICNWVQSCKNNCLFVLGNINGDIWH